MARLVWQLREWAISGGTTKGSCRHWSVFGCLPACARTCSGAARWTVWHRGRALNLAGYAFVTRGKDYTVLDHPLVQARLHLLPDGEQHRPESQMTRRLYDCPNVPVGPEGVRCRVVVATHPAGKTKSRVGLTRQGMVYELFFTSLPQQSFTACDVVELYLHRGAFEPTLSDEDNELDPDRWCSHCACGQ